MNVILRLTSAITLSATLLLLLLASASAEDTLNLAINAEPASGQAPLEVHFAISQPEKITSVKWDFDGDGIYDSTETAPAYVYQQAGNYAAYAEVTLVDAAEATPVDAAVNSSEKLSAMIAVEEPFSVTIIAAPSSGLAPLEVHFTTMVPAAGSYVYAWDFNQDGIIESTEQNPVYVFENAGEVNVSLTVTDAKENSVAKKVPIAVNSYDSKINLVSYFPTALELKENQVTFMVANEGTETIKDINAKIIGEGLQHFSSSTITRLKAGEQDSITVKINVLQKGNISAIVKIDEKSFPVSFMVAGAVELNKDELQANYAALRQKLQQLEDLYYQKKAENYLVDEIFGSIKESKGQMQSAQQQILTNHLEEAKVNLDMASPAIDEIARQLEAAKKKEQTPLMWMKENAIAITSIIAAVGTLGGIAVKVGMGAKNLGGNVKEKLAAKRKEDETEENKDKPENTEESKDQPEAPGEDAIKPA